VSKCVRSRNFRQRRHRPDVICCTTKQNLISYYIVFYGNLPRFDVECLCPLGPEDDGSPSVFFFVLERESDLNNGFDFAH